MKGELTLTYNNGEWEPRSLAKLDKHWQKVVEHNTKMDKFVSIVYIGHVFGASSDEVTIRPTKVKLVDLLDIIRKTTGKTTLSATVNDFAMFVSDGSRKFIVQPMSRISLAVLRGRPRHPYREGLEIEF